MLKTTKEKLSQWLGPEQWLQRIGLAAAGAISLSVGGVLAGWRDVLSSLLLPKLLPQLLLDTVWLLLLGLLLTVLSWWFYAKAVRFRSFGFMGRTPRKLRKDVLKVLREVVRHGNDDTMISGLTGLPEHTVTYALGELREYGWAEVHREPWGNPSVWHYATPAGRKIAVESFGPDPTK